MKAYPFKNVVAMSHMLLQPYVPEAQVLVDMTCGNGHDTAFLCRLAGPQGRVLALDIQPRAVQATNARLAAAGLAGIGDLIVTATSQHSRNNRAGQLIGQGRTPAQAVKEVGMVVEGMNALPAAIELSARYRVDMPIVQTVNAIVNQGMDPADAVHALMTRDPKGEI